MRDFVDNYIQKALENTANGAYYTYVVIRNSDNKIVGSTRYYDIAPSDHRVAIGFTFYTQDAQGTGVNGECKSLLLNQAFDAGFNRVEFHVDSRNERSLNALKKIGAVREGVLREHKLVQGDFLRDTVVLSVLKQEWLRLISSQ